MLKLQQEKRRTLVHSFNQLLRQMQLPETAATLVSEAALEADRDIEQDVGDITADSSLPERERSAAVAAFCSQCIQNLLREGRLEEALQVFEVIAPLHCPQQIDRLSLLFAQNYDPEPKSTQALLQGLLERPKAQQESPISVLAIKREIWFLKPLGQGVLVIDRESSAYVVVEGEVRHKREKLHSDKVLTVASTGQQFATGSLDRTARVWDSAINLLYTVDLHRARVNAVTFCGEALACFDQDATISLHSLPQLQRMAVFRTAGPFVSACYSRRARKIIGAMQRGGRSSISAVSLRRKRVEAIIACEQRILAVELTLDEKLVLANVKPCEIRGYCLASKQAVLVVRGFVQERHLMRMSQGGRAGELLAVSSEEGSVRVFALGEAGAEEVLRVQAQSQQSVNCVLWRGEQLFFGCDGGNLERLLPCCAQR